MPLVAVGQVGLALERDVKKLLTNNQHKATNTKTGKRKWNSTWSSPAQNGAPTLTGALRASASASVYTNTRKESRKLCCDRDAFDGLCARFGAGRPSMEIGREVSFL
jgi:hypothetical protein